MDSRKGQGDFSRDVKGLFAFFGFNLELVWEVGLDFWIWRLGSGCWMKMLEKCLRNCWKMLEKIEPENSGVFRKIRITQLWGSFGLKGTGPPKITQKRSECVLWHSVAFWTEVAENSSTFSSSPNLIAPIPPLLGVEGVKPPEWGWVESRSGSKFF